MTDLEVYSGAAVLGAISGMRSMAAPAIVSRFAHTGLLPLQDSQIKFLTHKNSAKTMAVMAIGEMVADKLPFIPNRTSVFPLMTRAVSGALSATAFTKARKRSVAVGALIGSLAAVGASYGAYKIAQNYWQKATCSGRDRGSCRRCTRCLLRIRLASSFESGRRRHIAD